LDRVNGAAMRIQIAQAVFPLGDNFDDPTITPESLSLVANSVREKCDGLDGVEDGIVSNPLNCPFDITDIPRCQDEALASCLTDRQINALGKINDGAIVDGRQVAPGLPLNSEMDQPRWQEWAIKAPPGRLSPEMPSLVHSYGTQFARNFVIKDPAWTIAGYDFSDWTKKSADALMKFGVNDPDLDEFQENGGKLLMSHGWSDPAISALGTIEFFESVERRDPNVRDYLRLYLQPGVLHCRGGTGPDYVDRLTELEQWVEHGNAPQAITAYKRNDEGSVAVERILCPYPQIAEHQGGDSNRAENYKCVDP
jgi:feruloyl esterase